MKHKSICTKILLSALCVLLTLSCVVCFASCGSDDETAALQETIEQLKNQVQANTDKLETVETKENVEALRVLVNEVKATADAAATLEALNEVSAQLTAVKDIADAAATKETLDEAIETIEGLISTGDGNVTTELNAKLEELSSSLSSFKESSVTDLNKVKSDLKALIDANKTAISELDKAYKAADDAQKADIAKLQSDLANAKTALEKDVEDINKAISELDNTYSTDAEVAAIRAALEKTIADNKKTADDAMTALDEAYKAADKLLKDDIDINKDSISALRSELNSARTELSGLITSNKSAIDALKENAATKEALSTAVKTLNDTIASENEKLDAKISELNTTLGQLTTTVGTNSTEISSLKGSLKDLIERVEKLEEDIAAIKKDSFKDDYDYASAILRGDQAHTDGKYYSLKEFDGLVATVKATDYDAVTFDKFAKQAERERLNLNRALNITQILESFARFEQLKNELPSLLDMVECRLNAIEGIDGACYADDETHNHSTPEYREKIELTEKFEAHFKLLDDTYKGMSEGDRATVEVRYKLVVSAYNNLKAASDAAETINGVIDAIDANMVLGTSNAAVEDAKLLIVGNSEAVDDEEKLGYTAYYFSNEDYNALYGNTDFLTSLAKLETYEAKLASLKAADEIKPEKTEIPAAPLFNRLGELEAHKAEIDLWASENEVDDVNRKVMYTEEYITALDTAINYATEMNGVYTNVFFGENGVSSLVDNIMALYADGRTVLLSDAQNAELYRSQLIQLKGDVNAIKSEFGVSEDGNFAAMFCAEGATAEDIEEAFGKVESRIDLLEEANGKFTTLVDGMNALLPNVAFDNDTSVKIKTYRDGITEFCTTYNLVEGAADYVEIVTPANETLASLDAAYRSKQVEEARVTFAELIKEMNELAENLKPDDKTLNRINGYEAIIAELCDKYYLVEGTAEYTEIVVPTNQAYADLNQAYKDCMAGITEIYNTIKEATDGMEPGEYNLTLSMGKTLFDLQQQISVLLDYGATDPDLTLPLEGAPKLVDVLTDYFELLDVYGNWAAEAEEEAKKLSAEISAALTLDRKNLNNFDAITTTMANVNSWMTTYLKTDSWADIAGIVVVGEDRTYTFLTETEYNDILAHKTSLDSHKAAAADAWSGTEESKGLSEMLTELSAPDSWNLHTDFETVDNAYKAYVNTYYADSIPASSEEAQVYEQFKVQMKNYEQALIDSADDLSAIKQEIAALDWTGVNADNAQAISDKVMEIRGLIAAYKSAYGCDLTTCICGCDITIDEMLSLAKAEAKAKIELDYAAFLVEYAAELALPENASTASAASGLIKNAVPAQLQSASKIDAVNKVVDLANNTLNSYRNQLRPTAAE